MDRSLVEFIGALRSHDIRVSPAETLDAMECLRLVGFDSRDLLRESLSMILAKTAEEKPKYYACFDEFFNSELLDGKGEPQEEKREASSPPPEMEGDLSSLLLEGNQQNLALSIMAASRETNLQDMKWFTQRGMFTRRILNNMGLGQLNQEIAGLYDQDSDQARELIKKLTKARAGLTEEVSDFVERQYAGRMKRNGRDLMEDAVNRIKLTNLDHTQYRYARDLVRRLAKKLVSVHSRRKRVKNRGVPDLRRTIAANAAYDGTLFDIHWRSKKVDRPRVVAICDVSGSVASVARFLLMFLYSLHEVIPSVRSYAFSSHLGEVTNDFKNLDLEEAINSTLKDYGMGSTDYGQSLQDFVDTTLKDLNKKTTVIMLGDARNNYGDAKQHLWKEVYERSQRVLWLNPEPKLRWNSGDSVMGLYTPYCSQAHVCNSLQDLNRIIGNILKHS